MIKMAWCLSDVRGMWVFSLFVLLTTSGNGKNFLIGLLLNSGLLPPRVSKFIHN